MQSLNVKQEILDTEAQINKSALEYIDKIEKLREYEHDLRFQIAAAERLIEIESKR